MSYAHTDATAAGFRTDADYSKEVDVVNGRREFVQWLPDDDIDHHDLEGVRMVSQEEKNHLKCAGW